MKNNFITKIIGATLAFAMMIGGAVGINAAKEAKEVNAAENDTHTFSDISFSKLLNNSASIDSVNIPEQDYTVKTIVANVKYNKTAGGVTITPTIGATALEPQTHNASSTVNLTWNVNPAVKGAITFGFVNNCGSGTGKGTFYFNSVTLTEGSTGSGQQTTYSITYNKNTEDTVTGMPSNQSGLEPGTYTLSDTIPERTGYVFGGWGEAANSSEPITSVTITNASKTVYAIWSESVVSGTFNKHTGALANGEYILTYGSVAMGNTVASSKLQNSSLSFTSGAASITDPVAAAVYRIESVEIEDVTYWTLKNVANNKYVQGYGASSTNLNLSDTAGNDTNKFKVNVSNNTYDFFNKTLENENSKRYIRAYNSVWGSYASSNGGALTLYKKAVSYTISYDSNGGSGTMSNSINTVSNCTFTAPNGKEFDHWNTAADNSGASYNPGATVLEPCTLYAIWRDLVPSVAINKNIVNLTIGGSPDTVTATPTNITNPTYSWSYYSGEQCVSLTNDNTDTVTIAVANNVTRMATCVVRLTVNGELGGNNITPITKDVTVKISRTSTSLNPFSVAEARMAIDELNTVDGAYVSGTISQIDSYDSQYHSITYWISDDGTTTNQLEVYSGKGLDGADFSSTDDIEIGANVTVMGNLKKHNSTYEFNYNNELISYEAPVRALSSIALSGTYPTEFLTGDVFDHEGMVVTATYDNGSHRDVTSDAVFSGYDMSTAGEQEITVSYEENGVTKTATYNITLTYVNRVAFNLYQESTIVEGDYIFYYNGYSLKNTIASNRAGYETVQVVNNVVSNYLDTNIWHIAHDGDYYTIYNKEVNKYLASTGSNNQAKLENNVTDNSRWTATLSQEGTYEFVNKAREATANKYLRNNGTNGWACYSNSTGGELSLFKKNAKSSIEDLATNTQLSYRYTGNAQDGFDYSDISIRFGANITKALWNELDTDEHVISGFGVIIADGDLVINATDMADAMGDVVSSTVTPTFTQDVYAIDYFVPVANMASVIGDDGDSYFWNLRWSIDEANMDKMYSAFAYIKVGDEYVLMNMARESVETLALDYLTNRGCNENTAEGSLQAIVNNA